MKRSLSIVALAVVLTASTVNAQPKRDTSPYSPFAPIIKVIRHLIGLDDPTFPKP